MKKIKPIHSCQICLAPHMGIHCVNCGAFEVGRTHFNREGKEIVRGIPTPLRKRIDSLERIVPQEAPTGEIKLSK